MCERERERGDEKSESGEYILFAIDDSDERKIARGGRSLRKQGIHLINYERRCGAERTNPTGSFVLQSPRSVSIISMLTRSEFSD